MFLLWNSMSKMQQLLVLVPVTEAHVNAGAQVVSKFLHQSVSKRCDLCSEFVTMLKTFVNKGEH